MFVLLIVENTLLFRGCCRAVNSVSISYYFSAKYRHSSRTLQAFKATHIFKNAFHRHRFVYTSSSRRSKRNEDTEVAHPKPETWFEFDFGSSISKGIYGIKIFPLTY
jgi:hypothetical protein